MFTLRLLQRLFITIAMLGTFARSEAQEFVMPDEKARELAYFGDIDALRQLAGPDKNLPALEKNTHAQADALFGEAVQGETWETISFLVNYGWPEPYPNLESWSYFLTPAAVREMAKRVPEFNRVMGDGLLLYALRQGNLPLIQSLKMAGVKLSGTERTLASATARRNIPMINWLLDQGTNPFLPARESAIDVARNLKSADLLALLDRGGTLSSEIESLRKQNAPSPATASLVGTWAHRQDGFGSIVVVLYRDGTGLIAGSFGTFPALWTADDHTVRLNPTIPDVRNPASSLEFVRESAALVLANLKSGERITLHQEPEKNSAATWSELRVRPHRLRIQSCSVDAQGIVWLGINGRHGQVSLAKLVEGAKQSPYGTEANAENIVDWESFSPGPVSTAGVQRATPVAVDNRTASPDYSPQNSELYLGHEKPATLAPDCSFTLFRGTPSSTPLRLDPASQGEYPYVFALLADKPFSHGKNWVLIFLRKGRVDHSGP